MAGSGSSGKKMEQSTGGAAVSGGMAALPCDIVAAGSGSAK